MIPGVGEDHPDPDSLYPGWINQSMNNDRPNHWYNFLEEESCGPNGLLCFYDVRKSREVVHCCKLLVEGLTAFLDESWETGHSLS